MGSILSGPIDIDIIDYLYRDSLHAGVPFGMHYDQQRLIGSLCLDLESPGIAITEKGRTAAELMVFARYVMFSEVYWHHAVRSATAMFQRVFFEFHRSLDLDLLFRCSEQDFVAQLVSGTRNTPLNGIAESLFGNQRRLYKRLAQFSFLENQQIFRQLAQRPYTWLQDLSTALAQEFSSATGLEILPHEVLVDAPPVCLEVQFRVNVYDEKRNQQRPLGDVSPVVRVLAEQQFDNFVKRVRIFVPALHLDRLRQLESIDSLIVRALETMAANSRERSDSETGTEQIDHRR